MQLKLKTKLGSVNAIKNQILNIEDISNIAWFRGTMSAVSGKVTEIIDFYDKPIKYIQPNTSQQPSYVSDGSVNWAHFNTTPAYRWMYCNDNTVFQNAGRVVYWIAMKRTSTGANSNIFGFSQNTGNASNYRTRVIFTTANTFKVYGEPVDGTEDISYVETQNMPLNLPFVLRVDCNFVEGAIGVYIGDTHYGNVTCTAARTSDTNSGTNILGGDAVAIREIMILKDDQVTPATLESANNYFKTKYLY